MNLYESIQDFKDAIITTSAYYNVSPSIVEKDYFVTIILKKLNEKIPGIMFKGGTSLSKCYKVINRFSEDIDLTLDVSHFTQSNKRNANKRILESCDELGFTIENRDVVENHSHGNYNCYYIRYPVSFDDSNINPFIKLEMVFMQKSYPDDVKPVCSLIGEYLEEIDKKHIINEYNLEPFKIKTQSLERTFIDKIFALCDYYLLNEQLRQSRHIYDLYQLSFAVEWKNMKDLIDDVREERSKSHMCLSASEHNDVSMILKEIVDTNFFKKDYEDVTMKLLNKKII